MLGFAVMFCGIASGSSRLISAWKMCSQLEKWSAWKGYTVEWTLKSVKRAE